MQGTIHDFNYGAVTPVVAYVMAYLGGALGLRCTIRSVRNQNTWKPGWLALGAAAIGSGMWTMHFIAMIGFHVEESPIGFETFYTVLSLVVAVLAVGIGVFIVGYRAVTPRATQVTAVLITGFGIAAMHYIGMAGMRLNGSIEYDIPSVVLSVLIALVAAATALWAGVALHNLLASLGASMVMGIAVTGMHYMGMNGITVHLHGAARAAALGDSAASIMFPMLFGPAVFLLLAGVVVMFDPLLVLGDDERPSAAGHPTPSWGQSTAALRRGTRNRPGSRDTHTSRDTRTW